MTNNYNYIFLMTFLLLGVWIAPISVLAQGTTCSASEAECLVEWDTDGDFVPVPNALRNTVANDTADGGGRLHPDRVYVLEAGGTYHIVDEVLNNGFKLHLRSETEAEATAADRDGLGPARIQLATDDEGNSAGRLFTAQGDLTFEGILFSGMHDAGGTGNYLPIRMSSDGARLVIRNCIFEQSDFSLFGFDSRDNKVYIYDSIFRNHIGKTQQWEGRGLRFEKGADTLIVENSTYYNLGHTVIQSEAGPINYFRFVHNTVMNIGRTFNSGNFWKEGYVANNLFVNHYWHGEGDADGINDGDREFPYTGFVGVAPIGPGNGFTDIGRRIVYSNNAHWRDTRFDDYYADSINAQPLFNSETDSMFNTFDASGGGQMYRGNNWEGTDPNIYSYHNAPDLGTEFPEPSLGDMVPNQIDNIRDLRESRQSPMTDYAWEPGRNPDSYSLGSVLPKLVQPGDFSFTESTYLEAGTDELPLGDLNWHESSLKEDWLANRDSYVSDIEDLAGQEITSDFVTELEAEDGTIGGGAEIIGYDYPLDIRLQEGPTITWTTDIEAADTYTLSIEYWLDGGEKGQKVSVNGTVLNDGNDIMFTGADNTRHTLEVDADLVTGENEIQIIKSWGWMYFGSVEITQGETVVQTLEPINAVLDGDVFFVKVNEEDPSPSSGFYHVNLPDASSSIDFSVEIETAGTHDITFIYQNSTDEDQTVDLTINDDISKTLSLEPTGTDFAEINSGYIELNQGTNTVKFEAVAGGIGLDKLDFFYLTGVSNELENNVPTGFQLSQNYPNPFNPTTKINYTIPEAVDVQLTIYNILGQKVATLVDGKQFSGSHTVNFDARNLASGIYFYRLKAGDVVQQRKMTLIK